jgi:hypothetical protein
LASAQPFEIRKSHDAPPTSLAVRIQRERPRRRRAAEQRDELATPQLIELHSIPASQAGLQDTELARISQEVTNPLPRVADV